MSEIINWLRSGGPRDVPTLVVSKRDSGELGPLLVKAYIYANDYPEDWEAAEEAMPGDATDMEKWIKDHADKERFIDLTHLCFGHEAHPAPKYAGLLRNHILEYISRPDQQAAFSDESYFNNSNRFGLREDPDYLRRIYEVRADEDDYLPWVQFKVLAPNEGGLTTYYFWVDREGDARLGLYFNISPFDAIDEVLHYVA